MLEKIEKDKEMENTLVLSILMPTIPERYAMFHKLKLQLQNQIVNVRRVHPVLGKVEVLVDERPKFKDGGPDIGEKRQALLDKAKGEYVCFLDDDESIAPNYVEEILRLCYRHPDVGSFSSIAKMDNFWCVVVMSMKHAENQQAFPGIVLRKPWHICPVRTELAKRVRFPKSNYGEDWVWFEKVLELCKTEENTKAIIHQYNHSMKVSQSDNVSTAVG
jgi:hypothetical protein